MNLDGFERRGTRTIVSCAELYANVGSERSDVGLGHRSKGSPCSLERDVSQNGANMMEN